MRHFCLSIMCNEPASNIPTSISAIQLIVMSPFTIPSNTTVDIDNTTGAGDGVITSMSGANLTVIGTLNVNNAHDNGLEIGQDGTQLLNLGTISVNGSNAAGVFLTGSGTSVNQGNFTINHSGTNGILQLDNAAPFNSFDNQNCLVINNSGSDAIDNRTFFENSNKITVEVAGGHGINNTIGNGNLGDIGSNGINVTAGTFINNSTVAQGGGMIAINGVVGDGINLAGTLENGGTAVGDSLGIIMIDNVNGNGVNLNDGSDLLNQNSSSLLIGQKGPIKLHAIRGSGVSSFMNNGGTILLNGELGTFDLSSPVTNMGDCALMEITGPTDFAGGLVNNAIIISSAPTNSITGNITNNGIIIVDNRFYTTRYVTLFT